MHYILFVVMYSTIIGSSGITSDIRSVTTAEFNSKQACKNATEYFTHDHGLAFCVPKD